MTDYLYSVKKLVERLKLQSSAEKRSSHVAGNRLDKISTGSVSDTALSDYQGEVRYRRRKHIVNKKFSEVNKSCNASKSDISDSPARRRPVSLYMLIKQNKEKLRNKNSSECNMNLSASNSPISPLDNKQRTIFEFNVFDTKTDVYSEERDSSSVLSQKRSPRPSKDTTGCSFLSPKAQFISEPPSPRYLRKTERNEFTCSDKFQFQDSESKSPSGSESVFLELESPARRRTSVGIFRPRLSTSKSMPLSPPAVNAEKSAQLYGDFQLKLDTLRAELLAMRRADQELARRLLSLYSEIQVLKVKNSCMNYGELIAEAMYEAEMADEVPDMCDAPKRFTSTLLTSHGVTSFNIHARRFSCS